MSDVKRSRAPAATGARAEAGRALRRELRSQIAVLGGAIALLWLIELVDSVFLSGRMSELGIRPRTLIGLLGIPLHPFIHGSVGHLADNTIGLAIAGWFVVNRSRRDFFLVWGCATLVGGVGTWLVGRGMEHIGASGVVMGLMGCLIFRGWFERRFLSLALSVLLIFAWGGSIIAGIIPDDAHISWEVHLFGFAGGVLAARLTRRRKGAAARTA